MSDSIANLATPAAEQPQAACERCGRPGASKFGDEFICDDCYVARGSCCAEWFEEEKPQKSADESQPRP